jgi:hypothetical protein
MGYQLTSAILGLAIATTIFFLIRNDHLHTRHAFWWLFIAVIIAVLGIFPQLVDILALYLNVYYPPTLLLVISVGLIAIKVLSIDIHQSQQERRIRRLIQKLAILEAEKRKLQQISQKNNLT